MSKNYDNFLQLECSTYIKEEINGYYVFEHTVFYGEKGGQLSDKGTINGKKVLELKWQNDQLLHKVDGILENPIHMKVDFETRLINTAVQSAYHILDGYYAKKDLMILAIGVNNENHWYEVNSKNITEEDLTELQDFMNHIVIQDIPTTFHYMKGSDYPNPTYHKYDELRIVTIGNLDCQPCGTPHVNHSYEIGNFIILGSEKTARGTKIFTTCSLDVNHRMKKSYQLIQNLKKVLSSKEDEIIANVETLITNNKLAKKEIDYLKNELVQYKCHELLEIKDKVIICNTLNSSLLRPVSQMMMKQINSDICLLVQEKDTLHFALISYTKNARNILEIIKQTYVVQGGGSPQLVSASVKAEVSKFKNLLETLL